MMIRVVGGALCAAVLMAGPAWAQSHNVKVRGTIEKVDGSTLTVKSNKGETDTVKLTSDGKVVDVVKASLADIKPGVFVGATAVPASGGHWQAVEVHLFPESMRGTGEGDRPYDLKPKSTMTNGTVGGMGGHGGGMGHSGGSSAMKGSVAKSEGTTLTLDYQGGKKTVDVTPKTVIVALQPGSPADLKAGARVVVSPATKQADGTYATTRVIVGRDGVTPPM